MSSSKELNVCTPDKKILNVIDLFCGCGGMSKGLVDAGLHIIAGIDVWDKAIDNYNKNFKHKAYCEDLTKLPPEKFNEMYNVNNNDIDVIVGGPPCFIEGTRVLTNNGYKYIENVVSDDNLLTHTGKFQKIVNLQKKVYSGDLYELDIKYHPELIRCTDEHPFLIRYKKIICDNSITGYKFVFGEPIWKPAKDLTSNDYYGMVINTNNIIPEFIFDKSINQNTTKQINIKLDKLEYWYMMGYYIGNMRIEKTKKKENRLRPELLRITNQNYACTNYIWFHIFKMFGKYEHDKLIPEWVQDAPKEFIQEFINGYMKTDVNINKKGDLQLKMLSYNLAYGLQRLYLKLGHIVGINKFVQHKYISIARRIANQRNNYYITKEKSVYSFIEDNYVWYEPFKITKKTITKTLVYNFEVENDNSYIVENTCVHNCQSYSIAGKRDKNDPRNSLFMEYLKYLDYFKPKAFIMENVIGILSKKTLNNEKIIDIIMEQLTINYNCIINKLYSSDFEVPQNRRRVIIIGIRKDLNIIPTEPEPIIKSKLDRIPVKTILLQREDVDKKYYLSERALTGIKNKIKASKEKGFGFGAQMLNFEKPSYTIPARYWKDGYDALVRYTDTEIRRLTIIELKRIQSFPDSYIIDGSKKDIIIQIGNAVACRFAFHLGKYIINILP